MITKKELQLEQEFNAMCLKHGARAAIVIAKDGGDKGTMLALAGDAQLCEYLEKCTHPHIKPATGRAN